MEILAISRPHSSSDDLHLGAIRGGDVVRDIKFRGYDLEHKVWRYGWITQLVEGARRFMAIVCDDSEGDLTRYYIHDDKSVGQYTGLKDKNGVEIYEGDILNIHGVKTPVTFESAKFYARKNNEAYTLGGWDRQAITVIGNIYEHGDLLNDKNT